MREYLCTLRIEPVRLNFSARNACMADSHFVGYRGSAMRWVERVSVFIEAH